MFLQSSDVASLAASPKKFTKLKSESKCGDIFYKKFLKIFPFFSPEK